MYFSVLHKFNESTQCWKLLCCTDACSDNLIGISASSTTTRSDVTGLDAGGMSHLKNHVSMYLDVLYMQADIHLQ